MFLRHGVLSVYIHSYLFTIQVSVNTIYLKETKNSKNQLTHLTNFSNFQNCNYYQSITFILFVFLISTKRAQIQAGFHLFIPECMSSGVSYSFLGYTLDFK